MKAAVLSESDADEAVLKVLVESCVGRPIEWHDAIRMRHRGVDAALNVLAPAIKGLHYRHTDVRLLVVTVDSDNTAVPTPAHDADRAQAGDCRLCQIQTSVNRIQNDLRPIPRPMPLDIAVGLAVPSLEAWLLHGRAERSELAWSRVLATAPASAHQRKLELKQEKYGTTRSSTRLQIERGVPNAHRIAGQLLDVARDFRGGFKPLYDTLRSLAAE